MTVNLRSVSEKQDLSVMEKENPDLRLLFQIYPSEEAAKLINNKDKLIRIAKFLNNVTNYASINTMVMKCNENCVHKDICVLKSSDMAPYGFPCPIEKKIIMEMESDIITSLEIDRNNPIEMEMLWDLIDAKLLDMRSSGALKDGKLVQIIEQKIGQAVVTREEMSPNIEVKLELKKLKQSIIDAFVGSRRSKKKYGMASDQHTLEQMIMNAAKNIQNKNKDDKLV